MAQQNDHQTVNLGDDVDSLLGNRRIQSSVLFFHYFFRSVALVVYLFANVLIGDFIVSFLLIVLFNSLDFWTVKNITGRKLVGLRWWNQVDENGQSVWKYESKKENSDVNAYEKQLFWTALVAYPFLWSIFTLITFFSFKWNWMIICIFSVAMMTSNLFGYLRCRWNSRQEFSSYLKQGILKKVVFENPVGTLFRRRPTATAEEVQPKGQTLIDM